MQLLNMYMPENLVNIPGLYSGWNLYIWITAIIVQFILTIILAIYAKSKKELPSLYHLLMSYSFLTFSLAMNRIFFLAAYLTKYYNLGIALGYVWACVALIPVIYVIEHYIIKKTHYIFTIISLILLVLAIIAIFLPDELLTIRTTLQLLSLVPGLAWFILYSWIIKQTTGAPRKKAILIILSILIALIGFTLDSEIMLEMQLVPVILPPILYLIGVAMLGIVLVKND